MNVIVNSTPLIELSKIRRLTLLRDVYGKIIIPEEVHSEVVIHGAEQPGAAEVGIMTTLHCSKTNLRRWKSRLNKIIGRSVGWWTISSRI